MSRVLTPLLAYGLPLLLLGYSIWSAGSKDVAPEKDRPANAARLQSLQIAKNDRNPFVATAPSEVDRASEKETPAEAPLTTKTALAGLQLGGICVAGKKRWALIGDAVYSEGMPLEKFADARIASIHRNEVVIQVGNESFTINYQGLSAVARGSETQPEAASTQP